ncbi:spore germination protein GerPE [Peribacillus sp. SCS-26]|uniref:spore germination protein GerPE n=1 Tax=Paraperibacillus marinus TaxID=3115295 RepID=UPI0039061D3E
MFQRRISQLGRLNINTLIFSSTVEIGDSSLIDATNFVYAVQREAEYFSGKEGSFNEPLFIEKMQPPQITENVIMNYESINPFIKVGFIDIIGDTAASIVHIGSTCDVRLQSKIKNVRDLIAERPRPKGTRWPLTPLAKKT